MASTKPIVKSKIVNETVLRKFSLHFIKKIMFMNLFPRVCYLRVTNKQIHTKPNMKELNSINQTSQDHVKKPEITYTFEPIVIATLIKHRILFK